MLEGPLVRPSDAPSLVDGTNCRMTRSELQKRLAECAFGRNQVIFDAYFRWSDGTSGQPYCNVCFRPIGVHNDDSTSPPPPAPTPAPAPAPTPAPTPHSAPPAAQPPPGYAPMQLYPGYPPPQGQPINGIPFYAPGVYQPPVYAPWGSNGAPPPVGIPYPMKMIAGDGGSIPDTLNEGFQGFNLIIAGVFSFFFGSSLVTALGLLGDDDRDGHDDSWHSPATRSDPYVFGVCAVWGIIALVYAYRCRKFCCRVHRGTQICSEESRLLTALFTTRKTIMEWRGIAEGGGQVEVIADPTAGFCCFPPQWVLIVLRPTQACSTNNGDVVLLARCSRGIVDVEARAWTTYIDALRHTSSGR
jgi:hypothetical protein